MMLETLDLTQHTTDRLVLSIDEQEYATQQQIEDAKVLVEELDFMDQNEKLISYHGWDSDKVMSIEGLYKEWLVLHKVYSHSVALAPNEILDEYWHHHILDTKKYMDDCNYVFGYYLHHYPYFGLTEKETKQDLAGGFELTRKLFKKHFGHDLLGKANPCSSTSCR
jgi:hypothetical protein